MMSMYYFRCILDLNAGMYSKVGGSHDAVFFLVIHETQVGVHSMPPSVRVLMQGKDKILPILTPEVLFLFRRNKAPPERTWKQCL